LPVINLKDYMTSDPEPEYWVCACGSNRFNLWSNGSIRCAEPACGQEVTEIEIVPIEPTDPGEF
jgi:hypothetical protein